MPANKPISVIESFDFHGINVEIQSSNFKPRLTKKEHQDMLQAIAETIMRISTAKLKKKSHHHQDVQKVASDMSQGIANMEDFANTLNALDKKAEHTDFPNETNQKHKK